MIQLMSVSAHFENLTFLEVSNISLSGFGTPWVIHVTHAIFSQVWLTRVLLKLQVKVIAFKDSVFRQSTVYSYRCALSEVSVLFTRTVYLESHFTNSQSSAIPCKALNLQFVSSTITTTIEKPFLKLFLLGRVVNRVSFNGSHILGLCSFSMIENRNILYLNIHRSVLAGQAKMFLFRFALGRSNILTMFLDHSIVENELLNDAVHGFIDIIHFGSTTNNIEVHLNTINSTFSRFKKVISVTYTDEETGVLGVKTRYRININTTNFTNNYQCIHASIPTDMNLEVHFSITNSLFKWNQNVLEIERNLFSGLTLNQSIFTTITLSLTNTLITNNKADLESAGIIKVVEIVSLLFKDCQFVANIGTAIVALSSNIAFEGHNLFQSNTGRKGGAIALHHSTIYVSKQSSLAFFGNHAHDVDGAIFVSGEQRSGYKCFIKPKEAGQSFSYTRSIRFNFANNSAMKAGENIYGASLKTSCTLGRMGSLQALYKFNFTNVMLSSVTSDPRRVCLCNANNEPQCANMNYIYRQLPPRYPGETFMVSVAVVGYDFGTVPGIVYSTITSHFQNDSTTRISENQRVQENAQILKCTKLNLTIQTSFVKEVHSIQLSIDPTSQAVDRGALQEKISKYKKYRKLIIDDLLMKPPVVLQVLLEDCPIGFQLTNTPPYICTRHHKLEENGVTVCVISNHIGRVYRSGTLWVSSTFTENETNSFVIHPHCPHDYCKPDNISVDLTSPDTQCAFNRSGVLCGGCYGNLSLALGSSTCLACDNIHVSLLIVFIVSGLALVFFIKILDLTVSKGTINGLIFYANIVWANKNILFPTSEKPHPTLQILHTFIAWLNLDLGIETCFMNGLDGYWKTWLQFVFPIYIWSITGAIIIAARYSTRASKIFGNNSVPVLATLILLSYTKLLRTIITSLAFSVLEYPDGPRVVWSFDGNIPYFGGAHTILFLIALAALLLLWLPYTTVLLTLQWLRRKGNLKLLRWINRWKPFFDAYFGLLKPKHHYWVGLLLLIRVFLLVLLASTSAVVPKINIIAIAFTGIALFIHCAVRGLMYKTVWLSIVELSFIVNLTVLAVLKPYAQSIIIADSAVVHTSIAITLLQFIGIIIYHVYVRFQSTYIRYKRRHTARPTDRELRALPPVAHNQMQYREPLLESRE